MLRRQICVKGCVHKWKGTPNFWGALGPRPLGMGSVFYLRDAVRAVITTATCLAGWLSHSVIVSKWLNLSENFFDRLKAPSF